MTDQIEHHDGFALFKYPESAGKRSSVHYGPKRDFIGELFAASKKYQPHLRRGTYFSLPEWYNPQYKNGDSFPGGPPTNPYTGKEIEYTGYTPVNDFVNDIQVTQMNALAYDYGTELMWCDIGGPNNSTHMLSKWINWARDNGHQVAFDSRCGLTGDFDTPEYDPNPTNPFIRKWESSRGMDPHSYGYNHVTPDDEYLTGHDIVESLVDIVSNNGNFLLDIGPKGDGSIPEIMKKNLLDAGKWINAHAESIFNTRYWTVTTGKDPFRYTTTENAFYIHYTKQPSKTIVVEDPVPFLPGDIITVVGGKAHGRRVSYTWTRPGSLTLHLDDNIIAGDEYVWTFKIQYGRQ
ncbi:hypothetical protein Golomagni_05853 [Golovinomyces magnicellulatus]|nr:hypothetical protein Golomagni_05853 [Golovinomyces magnicellulatus]